MKHLLIITLLLLTKFGLCQVTTQEDQMKTQEELNQSLILPSKAIPNWDYYKFYPFRVSVKLPGKPKTTNNSAFSLDQVSFTLGTEKFIDTNYMYFTSVIKFKNGFSMDSNDINRQKELLISDYKKMCKFEIISENEISYESRKGIQIIADVIWPDNSKFQVRMEFTYYGEYCINQVLLGKTKTLYNWSSEQFFSSIKIE